MTSSNATAVSAPAAEAPTEPTPAAADAALADRPAPAPFEFLPVGEAFGVCDVDGECR